MNDSLAERCQKSSIVTITDYREWTRAVKQEDNLLRQDLKNAHSVSLNVLATNSKSRSMVLPSPASIAPTPTSVSAPTSSSPSALPKLSDEEKKILAAHDGCFKCRRPYAGHCTRECTNGFPLKYVPITTTMAEAIRMERNRVPAITAVLHFDETLPSAVLGNGSEESDDSDF